MSIADLPTLAGPIEDELIDHEFEALVKEATARRYAVDDRIDGLPPTVGRLSPDLSGTVLGEGSEPELRDDEVVCEVTNLTYLRTLPRSPHIDEEGVPVW